MSGYNGRWTPSRGVYTSKAARDEMRMSGSQFREQAAADAWSARLLAVEKSKTQSETHNVIPEQPTKSPTFAKLRSGAWGIRYEGHAEPGQILNVQLKSGKFKPIKLGNMVFDRDGVKLFTIDEGKDEQEETL